MASGWVASKDSIAATPRVFKSLAVSGVMARPYRVYWQSLIFMAF
jgi:hypothetical protein